jgi:hypothetical protein
VRHDELSDSVRRLQRTSGNRTCTGSNHDGQHHEPLLRIFEYRHTDEFLRGHGHNNILSLDHEPFKLVRRIERFGVEYDRQQHEPVDDSLLRTTIRELGADDVRDIVQCTNYNSNGQRWCCVPRFTVLRKFDADAGYADLLQTADRDRTSGQFDDES